MLELFTDRARHVMKLAETKAKQLNHEYVGTEHVLTGLIEYGQGISAAIIKNLRIDKDRILRSIKLEPCPAGLVAMGKLPHTPRVKALIEKAITAARELNHNYVGTEHLLLAFLELPEAPGSAALLAQTTAEAVRAEISNIVAQTDTSCKPVRTFCELSKLQKDVRGNLYKAIQELIQLHAEIFDYVGDNESVVRCREAIRLFDNNRTSITDEKER